MFKVCVVEDEKSIAELIKINLELEGYQTTIIHNGREAINKAADFNNYALIILDVMLPEVSGLDICNEIRKFSDVPILFLSAKGTTEDRIAGLKLGGNDYLSKPFDLEELLLRVRILSEGSSNKRKSLQDEISIGGRLVNFETFIVNNPENGASMMLSKKEIELLRLFSEREGIVISRNEILDKVWGKDQFPTTRTIDNYILNFRKLFEIDPKNPIYFHSIRAVGYRFTNVK